MFKRIKAKEVSESRRPLSNTDSRLNESTQFNHVGKQDNDKGKYYYCPVCGHEAKPDELFCQYDGMFWGAYYSVYADRGLITTITDKLDMTKAKGDCIFDFIYCTQSRQLYVIMVFEQCKDFYLIAGWSKHDQFCQVDFVIPGDEIVGFEEIWKEIRWEKEYGQKNQAALFYGCNWGLRLRYKNINIRSEGYDAYPENFKLLVRSLYLLSEKLRITYDRDSVGSTDFEVGKIIQGPFAALTSAGALPFCCACGRKLKPDQVICECGQSRYQGSAVPRIIEPIRKREVIFYFSYGTIHGDQVDYMIVKRPEALQVVLDSRSNSHVSFMIPDKEICLLAQVWKDLRWRDNYFTPPTPGESVVLDGLRWRLEITCHDFQMNSRGQFEAPTDFDSFKLALEKRLKKLQYKYGDGKNTFDFDRDRFGLRKYQSK